ncbi:cell division protein FtsA [Moraxella sp. FZLJ2107]|uniref:cell division protein FtsA n=1 Tax=unclassified Moraxella TaxID=2685852 RepID=UPI00209C423B|nr:MULTISPECIES: cell division protein FtsA [unclassified Moraxella]USZ14300.1 cell division protein FtsA [Moraxella sp. FZFQ2102]UTO04971.1 cell division protein FtsA [Moraxella sp. FZLJ2107]UTO21705.1 cell division protein FtsA [Moraxella sp. FZLJ2109]
MSNLQAVIHISSSAVCTVIGQIEHTSDGNRPKIMAVGLAHTDAFSQGQIVHREHLRQAVHKSLQEAMDMSGTKIYTPIVSYATPLMVAENDMRQITIEHSEGIIHAQDLYRAQAEVKQALHEQDRAMLQSCQQMVCLENDEQVLDPIGLRSKHIRVFSHVMSVPTTAQQQIMDLLIGNDIEDAITVFDGVAGTHYTLTENEKRQGVCYIDIGATMTKVCVYHEGLLVFSDCIAVGGQSVDLDIAKECGVALGDADSFKRQEGTLNSERHSPGSHVIYKKGSKHEKTMLRRELNQVIEARYYAIFSEVFDRVTKAGLFHLIDAGVVLAGGATQMDGLTGFLRAQFGVLARRVTAPTNIAFDPNHLSDDIIQLIKKHLADNTMHSAIGLLMFSGSDQFARDQQIDLVVDDAPPIWESWLKTCKRWLAVLKKFS